MLKKSISLLCIGFALMGCNEQDKRETEQEFVDNVRVALADSGHIDLDKLQWTREPKG